MSRPEVAIIVRCRFIGGKLCPPTCKNHERIFDLEKDSIGKIAQEIADERGESEVSTETIQKAAVIINQRLNALGKMTPEEQATYTRAAVNASPSVAARCTNLLFTSVKQDSLQG